MIACMYVWRKLNTKLTQDTKFSLGSFYNFGSPLPPADNGSVHRLPCALCCIQ